MSNGLFCCCLYLLAAAFPAAAQPSAKTYRISGPYTHDNLSIFLIHAKSSGSANYLTLREALDQGKVVVHETGSVNELAIENLSSQDVYIQSGDIVKGGKQDRVFPEDTVLMPHSGKVPIPSFCVEHGRWTRRGAEASDRFTSSNQVLAMKPLKMAARKPGAQAEVWNEVEHAQRRLAQSVGVAGAFAPASPTSMQLTLENKQVTQATGAYVDQLSSIVNGKADVVGYAFAVDGAVNSADIYRSNDLFRGMWPKLLKAAAVEAVAERRSGTKFAAPTAADIRTVLSEAENGRQTLQSTGGRAQIVRKDSAKTALFDTRDSRSGESIHKNYVVK